MSRPPAAEPLVVIGIPTYNRGALLRRAIDSALGQDYRNIQVLISDNASTDGTEQLCREVQQRDPRVRYLRHPQNLGATENFRAVLRLARGDLYMWLADDDWLPPEFVGRCVAALQADPGLALAGGRGRFPGTAAGGSQPVNCLGTSAFRRVLAYYRHVADNSVFYGVMRLPMVASVELRNWVGGDWLMVAALAAQGRVRTLEGLEIHRERGGTSQNRRRMTASLGVPAWQAVVPVTVSVAVNALVDVLTNRAYGRQPWWWRLLLAAVLPAWIVAIKPAQEIRRRLQQRFAPA